MNWYLMVLKNYATFSGRSRRKEYWIYSLFSIFFIILTTILDSTLGLNFGLLPYGVFYLIYTLGTFIPGLAVMVRRLHDTNHSGWWFFMLLIPIIGAIWILVLLCQDSDAGDNKYGPNPKGVSNFNSDALDSHLTH